MPTGAEVWRAEHLEKLCGFTNPKLYDSGRIRGEKTLSQLGI